MLINPVSPEQLVSIIKNFLGKDGLSARKPVKVYNRAQTAKSQRRE
jgi:hypothetical protein